MITIILLGLSINNYKGFIQMILLNSVNIYYQTQKPRRLIVQLFQTVSYVNQISVIYVMKNIIGMDHNVYIVNFL